MKELIVSYRKMFQLLKLDLPNWNYGKITGVATVIRISASDQVNGTGITR